MQINYITGKFYYLSMECFHIHKCLLIQASLICFSM